MEQILGIKFETQIGSHLLNETSQDYVRFGKVITHRIFLGMWLLIPKHWSYRTDVQFCSRNWSVSQIPQCTRAPSCNRNVHTCAHFGYKMVHCGIWDRCIVRFMWQVYYIYWLDVIAYPCPNSVLVYSISVSKRGSVIFCFQCWIRIPNSGSDLPGCWDILLL